MRVLVLGGSGFVGRAVADEAVARGHEVTVFNRGHRPAPAGVREIRGDRESPGALETGETWDAVVDTWSAEASPVAVTSRLLRGRAGHYTYVSSRSVYRAVAGLTEDSPLLDAAEPGYGGDKLRGEIATGEFGGPVMLARAGLILGPHEDIGRLPWWLRRLEKGGPTLAPGPRDLKVQYIDARDLAQFILLAAQTGLTGPFNLTSESGHTTMGGLLDVANEVTGGHAELRWTGPAVIEGAGVQPWTQLPVWIPPGPTYDFIHRADVSRAVGAGLRCRPVRETVADTWQWLTELPQDAVKRPGIGLDPAVEAKLLSE